MNTTTKCTRKYALIHDKCMFPVNIYVDMTVKGAYKSVAKEYAEHSNGSRKIMVSEI